MEVSAAATAAERKNAVAGAAARRASATVAFATGTLMSTPSTTGPPSARRAPPAATAPSRRKRPPGGVQFPWFNALLALSCVALVPLYVALIIAVVAFAAPSASQRSAKPYSGVTNAVLLSCTKRATPDSGASREGSVGNADAKAV